MKAQTMHTNVFGTVTNPSSANGFRLEDDHGGWVEANIVDGLLVVEYRMGDVTYEAKSLNPVCKKCREPLDTVTDTEGRQHKILFVEADTLRNPPRQLIDVACPVKFGEFDHGHPTVEALVAAAAECPECHSLTDTIICEHCGTQHSVRPGSGS